jgi:hypothetical protein
MILTWNVFQVDISSQLPQLYKIFHGAFKEQVIWGMLFSYDPTRIKQLQKYMYDTIEYKVIIF